jgi:hypothetical protein
MEAIDSVSYNSIDDMFFDFRIRLPGLSLFKVPDRAWILVLLCFYLSWRLRGYKKVIASEPMFLRIGRLGIGLSL